MLRKFRDLIKIKIEEGEYPISLRMIQEELGYKLLPINSEILDLIKSMGLEVRGVYYDIEIRPPREYEKIPELYYLTHVRNVPSMVEYGLLCRKLVEELGINHESIADDEIVEKRKLKRTPDGKTLDEFVNLYFAKKPPMYWRIVSRAKNSRELCYVCVCKSVLLEPGVYFSDGNAASSRTKIYSGLKNLKHLNWEIIYDEFWYAFKPLYGKSLLIPDEEVKRLKQAEVLVPRKIPPEKIRRIVVSSSVVKTRLKEILGEGKIIVEVDESFFWS